MFFKKKEDKEYAALKEETRQNIAPHIKHQVFEIEAHRQIAIKTDLWTDEEFKAMIGGYLEEAKEHFKDMDPKDILEDRITSIAHKVGAKVIEVRL